MGKAERFEAAYQAYVPAPDDCPDAIPVYRAFAGLRAVWGEDFYKTYNHAMHQAACWCASCPEGARYKVAADTLRDMLARTKRLEAPRLECSYDTEPQPPTEQDARALFNEQFRQAYPRKRANSKHANEVWETKKAKAIELVQAAYQEDKARYDTKQRAIDARNAQRSATHAAECLKVDAFKAAIEAALAEDV